MKLKIRYDMDALIDIVCGLSIIMIMPIFFSINSFVNYGIRWGLGLIFLFCVGIKDRTLFTAILAILISGFLYTLLYMYNVRMVYGGGLASFVTRSMLCWLYMAFALYYAKHRRETDNQKLGFIFTMVLLFTVITSILGMHRYSYLASGHETIVRTLGNGGNYSDSAKKLINRSNISSWQLAYGFSLSSIAYMGKFKKERKKLYIIVVAAIVLFLIEAQITFALLFATIPIIYYFVKKRSITTQIITNFFVIFIFIIFYFNLGSILFFLYEIMIKHGMTMLGIRFYQLYETTRLGDFVGTGAGRMEYYLISLNQFFNNPVLGYKLREQSELFTELGMHSQVFDTLGGTGIIGFMLYFLPFLYVIKIMRHCFAENVDKSFVNLGIIVLIVFMFTNPTTYACEAYMAVFCLPLWLNRGSTARMIKS